MDRKCSYCGNYLPETAKKCPYCEATNPQYQRTTKDTPQTIEKLQAWYKAQHLPPEEITRFFIGKNIEEPKAFGIYQDGENFIVYKNKANGERDVAFQGTDQAYAVNLLFLRLKDEIVSQKNRIVNEQAATIKRNPSQGETSRTKTFREEKPLSKRQFPKIQLPKLDIDWEAVSFYAAITLCVLAVISVIICAILLISNVNSYPRAHYYYSEDGDLYYNHGYNQGEYEWWKYNKDIDDWEIYSYTEKKEDFPSPLNKKSDRSSSLPFENHAEYTYEKYNIQTSHGYIDAHHTKPKQNYYICNGDTYYFLDDDKGDNTGWYVYDDSDEQWEFYAPYNDKESIDEDLWYAPAIYSVLASEKDNSISNFEDTSYYQEYMATNHPYEYQNQQSDDDAWHSNSSSSSSSSSWDYSDWNSYSDSSSSSSHGWDSDSSSSYGWDSDSSSSYGWDSDSSSSYGWDSGSTDYSSGWDSGSSWDYGDSGWDSGSTDWGSSWGSSSDYDWSSSSSWDYGDSGWDSGSTDWGSSWD